MLDEDLPCREMGLEFRRGDIIEIINQDDVDWWQVRWKGWGGGGGRVEWLTMEGIHIPT